MKNSLIYFFILFLIGGGILKSNMFQTKEITFQEAYHLGFKKAKELDKKAELMILKSVDDGKVSGKNGKRANWQGVFVLPNINKQILFVIEKGNMKNYELADKYDELTIKDEFVKIDSPQIVKSAIKDSNLQPFPKNDSFSHGYHFRTLRDEKNIFFAVNGWIDGRKAEIYYNPKTGEYMGRTESAE